MFCYVDSADPVGVLMKTRSSNLLIYIYELNSLNYIQQVKHSENIGLACREAQINVGKMTWKQKPYVSAFVNWLKFNTTEINIYHTLYLLNKYTQNVNKRFESVLQMFKYIDWLFLFICCCCSFCIFVVVKTKHETEHWLSHSRCLRVLFFWWHKILWFAFSSILKTIIQPDSLNTNYCPLWVTM